MHKRFFVIFVLLRSFVMNRREITVRLEGDAFSRVKQICLRY